MPLFFLFFLPARSSLIGKKKKNAVLEVNVTKFNPLVQTQRRTEVSSEPSGCSIAAFGADGKTTTGTNKRRKQKIHLKPEAFFKIIIKNNAL